MTNCFHCGLPADQQFSDQIDGEHRLFCCAGCRAVSQLIQQSGLQDFYQFRDMPLGSPPIIESDPEVFSIYADEEYQRDFVTAVTGRHDAEEVPTTHRLARLQLFGMNCSACAWLIEKQLERLPGVESVRVNYSQQMLFLQWNNSVVSLSALVSQVSALGFEFAPGRSDAAETRACEEEQGFVRRIGVAGIGMMQVGMYAMAGYFGASHIVLQFLSIASLLIATMVIFYAAKPFFAGAWRSLARKQLSMDVPVALALGLAYSASTISTLAGQHQEVYFDAVCMFSFFLLVSRYLEFKARRRWFRQRNSSMVGDSATLLDDAGNHKQVPSRSLRPGQTILVKTGEAFVVDVRLQSASTEVSQAQLTGEFAPIPMQSGEEISSGSINLGSAARATVIRHLSESTLTHIQKVVDQAGLAKPRVSAMADRLAGYFVLAVLIVAASSYLIWLQIAPDRAFWIALSVLVVSCPCALSLATPTALTVVMNHLFGRGILVQNPIVLELLNNIDQIVFDKTGTLTAGKFQIEHAQDLSGEGIDLQLARAAALEKLSAHPIAHAFMQTSCSYPMPNVADHRAVDLICDDWRAFDGRGAEGSIQSQQIRIGEEVFVSELVQKTMIEHARQNEDGLKKIYMGTQGKWLAAFSLSDQILPGAHLVLDQLRVRFPLARLSIFSGDSSSQVDRIAEELGIQDTRKGMSPLEKLSALRQLQSENLRVLTIGDGINDAPFLAAADISIAVSSAIDLSKQQADIVLLSTRLTKIDELFTNAKKARSVIQQNLLWALCYNSIALPFAVLGWVPPWLAALGMSISSGVVVLNALRAKASVPNDEPSRRETSALEPVLP